MAKGNPGRINMKKEEQEGFFFPPDLQSHQKEGSTRRTRKASWASPWELNCQELVSKRSSLSA